MPEGIELTLTPEQMLEAAAQKEANAEKAATAAAELVEQVEQEQRNTLGDLLSQCSVLVSEIQAARDGLEILMEAVTDMMEKQKEQTATIEEVAEILNPEPETAAAEESPVVEAKKQKGFASSLLF